MADMDLLVDENIKAAITVAVMIIIAVVLVNIPDSKG
jgi:hypothetical protein